MGSVVLVRYLDHVLFRDADATTFKPWIRECVGWLDYEDEEYVRLVWERFMMPDPPAEPKPKATGLVIMKNAILEVRKVG